jgi:peptidoglycan/LPS O-acetylase OafA/YrhL
VTSQPSSSNRQTPGVAGSPAPFLGTAQGALEPEAQPFAAEHRLFRERKFFASLDGLRALSIVAVIGFHATGHLPGLLGRGYLGVELFFAISGLLITTLLLREQESRGQISLRGFYIRRTLRIFPLYFAVLAAYVTLAAAFERSTSAGALFFRNVPYYATYTSNWFVDRNAGPRVIFYFAWSLATEEQFYLFWPFAVRFLRRGGAVLLMMVLLAASEATRWALGAQVMSAPLELRVLASVASPICLGSLAAILLHGRRGFALAYRVAGRAWSAPLALGLLLACLAFGRTPGIVLSLSMTYLVVCCAIRADHSLRPLLDNRVARDVGTVSYGMYLLHMLVLNAVRRLGAGPIVEFALALTLTIAAARLVYRYFEQPFLRLKDRFAPGAGATGPADEGRARGAPGLSGG